MKFYITCRAMRFRDQIVTPKEVLKYSFVGIPMLFEGAWFNFKKDGRILYKIIINEGDPIKAQEFKDVIIEGLSMFGVHEKTEEKALEFIELIK